MNKTAEKLRITVCLALVLVTAAVYLRVGTHDFLTYDDHSFVCDNPHVYTGLSKANFIWAFTSLNGDTAYYHPLTWLTLQLDCQLFGLKPGPIHLTNLWFHLANTVLLFLLLDTITGKVWRSAIVAALFALHPLHIETVAWIAERKSLVCTFFWLLTTLAYVAYVRRPGFMRYALVFLLYAASLLSKPLSVTLPFTLLLLDYWPLGRLVLTDPAEMDSESPVARKHLWPTVRCASRLVAEKVPLLLLAAAGSVVAVLAQKDLGAMSTLKDSPLSGRIENAVISAFLYIRKMLWPGDLSLIYGYPPRKAWWLEAGCGLCLVCISVSAICLMRKRPYVCVGWFWYLGTLVPMLGLVQVGGAAMADRYTYITLTGIFVLVVWTSADVMDGCVQAKTLLRVVSGLPLIACVLMTTAQLACWKDSVRVFRHAARSNEKNFLAQYQLGIAYSNQRNLVEAESHFRRCLDLAPFFQQAHTSLGGVLLAKGDAATAFGEYCLALKMKPDDGDIHSALARFHMTCSETRFHDMAKAEVHAVQACEAAHYARRGPLLLLAGIYLQNNRLDQAEDMGRRLLRLSASSREVREASDLLESVHKATLPKK